MAVGTTAFPTSLDTAVELVEIKNNASSTLSGAVLIGDVTIGVTDIAEFPTTGFGTLTDDLTTPTKTEIISWTGISGSNLTGCTRGTQSTSAAAFSSGNFIEVRPTAGHHEALRGAVIAIETKLGSGSAIAVNKLAALTASRLMVTDASGFASAASVTATEAGYLSGVTSAIQTQLNAKGAGDALVANPLSQFAATTSLQLLGVISDETGSGALVFGTSPVLTTPDINGGTADSLTSLSVRSTGAAFDLLFANTEVLTGNKTLTFTVNDTNRTVDLAGNLTLAAAFSTSGANALTLTTTGATNVTLPTTGTLVNSAVTSLSSLTTVGTITSGGLGTGAVLGGVTMTLGSDADGDIYYRSSNVLTRLAKGTALQQLRMNAGATAPEWAAAAGGGLTIGTTAITSGTAGRILYETSGNVVGEIVGSAVTAEGAVTIAPSVRSSGVASYFAITTPADTGITADTESIGIRFGGNSSAATVTRTLADGTTLATQREYVFVAPTYAAAGATTITTAATLAITGAPIVGASTTITNSTAMLIQQGGDTTSSMLRLQHGHAAAGANTNVPFGIYDNAGTLKLGTRFVAGPGIWYWTAPVGAGRMGYEVGTVGGGSGLGTSDATNPTIYSQGAAIMWFNGSSGWAVINQGYQFAFGSSVSAYDLGFFRAAAGILRITNASTGAGKLIIGTSSASTTAADLYVVGSSSSLVPLRVDSAATPSVDIFQLTNNGSNRYTVNSSTTATTNTMSDVSGGTQVRGTLTESVTLSTSGTTTDSTIDLPANSIILSVTGRITTTITTATDWKLGDATIADRFSDANATLTSGTTTVGINQWKADRTTAGQGAFQQSTAKVRVTTSGTPGAGVVRITIHYITLSAPTS